MNRENENLNWLLRIIKPAKFQILLVFIFSILFFSCEKDSTESFEQDIIGEWVEVKILPIDNETNGLHLPPPFSFYRPKTGLKFERDGKFKFSPGYIGVVTGKNAEEDVFLGTDSKYKIFKDTLKTFDLSINAWVNRQILSVSHDTLNLKTNDGVLEKYTREHFGPNDTKLFDEVIVSSNYGSTVDVIVRNNKEIIFDNNFYRNPHSLVSSTISDDKWIRILKDFQKSNWSVLKNAYLRHMDDGEQVTVTFVKDKKILKTVIDQGSIAPYAFYWAYMPLIYLDQHFGKQKLIHIPDYLDIHNSFDFRTGTSEINLFASENFYLLNQFLSARKISGSFKEKYKIRYISGDGYEEISTDGRYFKFPQKNDTPVILDIGYNFITQNNLKSRLKKRPLD